MKTTKTLLDTNMLLVPAQFKVDIYAQIPGSFYTLDLCIRELEKIAEKKTKTGFQAKAALILVKMKNVRMLKADKRSTDAAIKEKAKRGYAVATNDRDLIKDLKKSGLHVLRLRQKKIVVEG